MIAKKHFSNGKLVLGICDKEIKGKKFEEGKLVLDLGSDFYNGEECSKEEILKLCKKAYIINAVGEKTVSFLRENKFVEEYSKIEKVPFAYVLIEN